METSVNNKCRAFTSLEQSRKLAEILPIESADMYLWSSGKRYYIEAMDDGDFNEEEGHVRAWSLAALLSILPDELEDNHFLTLSKEGAEYCCCYEDINGNSFRHTFANNPIDACVSMIEKLHELKML